MFVCLSVCGMKQRSKLIILHVEFQLSKCHLLERLLFPHGMALGTFVESRLTTNTRLYFGTLSLCLFFGFHLIALMTVTLWY